MAVNSLADWLRLASDDAVAALLDIRRDLAMPPPSDTTVLAARASTPGSVLRACESLNAFGLSVLETLLLLDADVASTSLGDVEGMLGVEPSVGLADLRKRALVWGEDDELRIVPAAREVSGPHPAGLGDPADLSTVDIEAALADTDESEKSLLRTLSSSPIGRTKEAALDVPLAEATTPIQRLLARKLLVRRGKDTVELPRQVGIALREGRIFDPAALREPQLPLITPGQSTVDITAAGEAMELLRRLERLLTIWGQQPPPVLKSGGLGVRELRKLARDLQTSDEHASLLAELAAAAGLVADSQSTSPEWTPTTLADSWLVSNPALRWYTVAKAWLELPRLPGLIGGRDAKDKPIAPLSAEQRRPQAPLARKRVFDALLELPDGTGVRDVESLVATLTWRAPRRGGRLRDEIIRWSLEESTALGITASNALTTAGKALLSGDRNTSIEAMSEAMPTPVDHVVVQADLTVVAPGPLEPELASEMATVADVESAGHATVYRITEASIRRGLDSGRTAAELHALFTNKSITPIPQSLTYLIDDVARRHGRLRGGAAASFLRCDDEILISEVLAHRVASEYDLRSIAPTVLISSAPLSELIAGLREAGFTPIAEGLDGRVLDLRSRGRRIPANTAVTARPVTEPASLSTQQITAVIAHLRAGDKAAERRLGNRRGAVVRLPAGGGADTSATLSLLSHATREQREVWIGFVDSRGIATERVITPVRVGGGMVESSDRERYPLHRITSAALIEE
jgi:hypothetical protein